MKYQLNFVKHIREEEHKAERQHSMIFVLTITSFCLLIISALFTLAENFSMLRTLATERDKLKKIEAEYSKYKSTKMIVEGVEAAKIASEWGKKLTLRLPITEELCRVLFESCPPDIAAANLMGRSLKAETE